MPKNQTIAKEISDAELDRLNINLDNGNCVSFKHCLHNIFDRDKLIPRMFATDDC